MRFKCPPYSLRIVLSMLRMILLAPAIVIAVFTIRLHSLALSKYSFTGPSICSLSSRGHPLLAGLSLSTDKSSSRVFLLRPTTATLILAPCFHSKAYPVCEKSVGQQQQLHFHSHTYQSWLSCWVLACGTFLCSSFSRQLPIELPGLTHSLTLLLQVKFSMKAILVS